MLPSIFGENLFDDFFDDFDTALTAPWTAWPAAPNRALYGKKARNL